jgi:hypothetical protein
LLSASALKKRASTFGASESPLSGAAGIPAGDDPLRAGLRPTSVAIPSSMIKIQSDERLDT